MELPTSVRLLHFNFSTFQLLFQSWRYWYLHVYMLLFHIEFYM